MSGLMFPKQPEKKKRIRHPASIVQWEKGYCYLCGRIGETERHHIFGAANKIHSEEYGLTVQLCQSCHRTGKESAHLDKETALFLHQTGQQAFERRWGSREEFMKIFGKNYL